MLKSNIRVRSISRSTEGRRDDWSIGFVGGFYEATITSSEPFTMGWTFNRNTVEYYVDTSVVAGGKGEIVKYASDR